MSHPSANLSAMSSHTLRRIGAGQLGLVTAAQARAHLSEGEIRTATRRGWLMWVRPRVLAFAGSSQTWPQSILAVILSTGPPAAASHTSAAALWDLPGFSSRAAPALEISVPRGRKPRLADVHVHSTLLLPEHHLARRGPIPVTSLERTLCDLDGSLGPKRLGWIVDELIVQRRLSIERLRDVHGELRRGARPSRALAAVLAERSVGWDHAESRGEARIARWLIGSGLPPPVQQHEVGGFRVDLAYPEHRVFIEYDGFEAHSTRSSFERDRQRANALALAHGATVLRYTWASTREEVVREVGAALRRARAS
jgi:hypothetical protein